MDVLAENSSPQQREREKLTDLFRKINHPLVDVRSRALKSLLFKLQNGLVSTTELIHERQLLIHLLEWFNFSEWVCETHALSLLCQLSEHEAAAETLVSVGATEFLTQLRPHLGEEPLCAILDDIIENLLKLPKAAVANQGTSYSSSSSVFSSVSTSDVGSYAPSTGSSSGWRSRVGVATPDHSHYTPEQHLEHAQSRATNTPTTSTVTAMMSADPSSSTGPEVFTAGWMQQQSLSSCSSSSSTVTASEKDEKRGWSQLQWLQLAIVDTQVLATTVNRLQSERGKRISSTCQFVRDVLLHDFPAELFLQRPAIVQSLLSLLTKKDEGDGDCCAVLECLVEIVRVVRKRVKVMVNPLISGMSDSKSVDHRNPSVDLTTSSSIEGSDLESFSPDNLQYLVSQELTLVNFSCSVLLTSIPLLLHHLHVCLSWLGEREEAKTGYNTDKQAAILCMCQLVTTATDLLVTACQHQKEEEIVCVNQLLECLASTSSQCISKLRRVRESGVATEPLLQVLCPVTTVLTSSLVQLIHTAVPVDQAGTQLSPVVSSLIRDLATAPVFTMSLPYSSFLLPYLKLTNPSYHKLYMMEEKMVDSFNHLSAVLRSKATEEEDGSILTMVSKGLQGLYFHCSDEFVSTAVPLCLRPPNEHDKEVRWKERRTILLSLLAHGSNEVATAAYECVKANWSTAVSDVVHLLCDDVFVRELVCHGILSSRKEVAGHAQTVLSHLLELLASSEGKWTKERRKQIVTLLPYIEASLSSSSCKCLRDQVLSIVGTHSCSLPQRLCCYIRMLYSSNYEIRSKAFSHLSSLLLAEDESMKHLLLSAQSSVTFHNILQSSCPLPPVVTISTKFKAEDVSNLIAVVNSATLEPTMRASALEQLIIVLHDHSLHSAALECGLLPLLTQSLRNHHQAMPADPSSFPMVPSCLSCLTLLAHSSPSVRDSLLLNEALLVDTIKCVLSYPDDSKVVGSCTRLLAYLSFSCVAQYTHTGTTGKRLALPEQLLPHLQFPFPVDPLVAVSPHHIPPLLDNSLLLSEPVQHWLSIRWVVSAHNGIPQTEQDAVKCLPAFLSPNKKACILFDLAILRHSHLTTAVTMHSHDLISTDDNAVSSKVERTVQLLRMTCLLPWPRSHTIQDTDHPHKVSSFLPLSQCVRVLVKQHLSSRPRTPADYSLLSAILSFLLDLFSLPPPLLVKEEDLAWLVEMMAAPEGVCVSLLQCDNDGDNDRTPQLAILKLLTVLLQQCNTVTTITISSTSLSTVLDICHQLLLKAAIPDHHDLSLLHHTLSCLLHTSATTRDCCKPFRPEWISTCFKLLTTLREVLWLFITGRGTVFSSFMGKQATRQSALILSHLLHSILSTNNCTGEWLQHWVLGSPPDDNMTWLHSLLTDRETEVRCAGYSILSLLCSHQLSAGMAVSVWQGMHSFGLWGACMDMALHDKETSLVKEQVLCVLSNLMCHDQRVIGALLHYQDEHGETLVGDEALDTILDQTNTLSTIKSYLHSLVASVEKAMMSSSSTRKESEREGISDGCLPVVACSSHLPVLSSLLWFISNCAAVFPHLFSSKPTTFDLSSAALRLLREDWLRMIMMAYSSNNISLHAVCVWVELYCSALRLLHCFMREEEDGAIRLVGLLHFRQQLQNISKCHSQQLCCEVVTVMTALAHSQNNRLSVFSALVKHWNCFAGLVIESMESPVASYQLMKGCLKLLCSLLVCTKPSATSRCLPHSLASSMNSCLDQGNDGSKPSCMSCYDGQHYSGKSLATVLIHQTTNSPLPTRRNEDNEEGVGDLVQSALSLLVANSHSAKQAALDAGLLESTIECAIALLTKLRQQSVGQHRQVKKSSSQQLELMSTLEVMRNLLYKSPEAKKAALRCGLVDVLHTLWPICSVRVPLLQTVVSLLCVLITSCQPANLALVSPGRHTSNSLLHSIIKIAVHLLSSHQSCMTVKTTSPHLKTLDPIFTLLATSSLSHEGRGALKKTGFLSRFLTLNPKQEKHSSHGSGSSLSSMWLRLLVCITFSAEGQAMFIRQTGSVELVCDMWEQEHSTRPATSTCGGGSSVRGQCALLLRNCCFYGPAKSILATNDQVVAVLSQCLQCEQPQLVSAAATAIWALLHNCTKLRGQLAHAQLPRLLQDAASRLEENGPNDQIKCSITNALSLLQQNR